MGAEYEVRITPLMRGVAGQLETLDGGHNAAGSTVIEEADTTLVTQFMDLEVEHKLNEPRTGRVVIGIHEEVVAHLEPFQQAVWIGYKRPGETLSEAIIYGQCNVITDYAAETVTLDIYDPTYRTQHHYIRRGDAALNVDGDRGRLEAHAWSITTILDAARNIEEQQDRGVPVLGINENHGYYNALIEDAAFIDFERGQECWDLIQQIVRGVGGPDIDLFPRWFFPTEGYYGTLYTYDPADPPPGVTTDMLARDLDPTDPNNPGVGEVIFDFGIGLDNLVGVVETPMRPTTHAHVLDQPAAYRETAADAASSEDVGIFVDWIATDYAIRRPTRAQPDADPSPLRALADAHVKAYGRPVKQITATMRPDDALTYHYGHPEWQYYVPPGVEYIGGDWYIGDYVRVRAVRGERSTSTLNRIVGAHFKYDLERDLVLIEITLIPALGGTPGLDPEDASGSQLPAGGTGNTGGGTVGTGPGTDVGGGGSTGLVVPSGEAMPTTAPAGWRRIFEDDFDSAVALGSFPSTVSADWSAYPSPWPDTSRNGRYDPQRTLSVHDGMLDIHLHTETLNGVARHLVAAPHPRLPASDPSVTTLVASEGVYSAMLYGRYSVRFRADANIPGYKTAWLLWPFDNDWPRNGEIDFPEGDLALGDTIHAFMHRQGATSGSDQDGVDSGVVYTAWHTAVIEWTPTVCRFLLDGVEIMAPTTRIPNTPMRWVLQTETVLSGVAPLDATSGHVYVDWVTVDAYDPP